MKKVLVTGATGFIGRHTLNPLADLQFEVHAVTSKNLSDSQYLSDRLTWHSVNLLDPPQVRSLLANVRPTHLLHFAWYNIPGKCLKAEENFLWVQGSLELLRQFYQQGGERVVIAGSCFEYDWNYGFCTESITPKKQSFPYAVCKSAVYEMLSSFADKFNISSAWGYIFNVYGPFDHPKRLVSSVIRSLLRQETALCSLGNQIRDYFFVQDMADAFVALLESNVTGGVNIASGQPIAVKDIIFKIADKFGKRELIQLGAIPQNVGEPPLLVANINRLRNEVGFVPQYNWDIGLDRTIEWWKSQLGNKYIRI